jgi:small multidrug resistance family-3 protein
MRVDKAPFGAWSNSHRVSWILGVSDSHSSVTYDDPMPIKSVVLFALAALAEIGGTWLIWQGLRENRGLLWLAGGVVALGVYGFVAALQPDSNFGRVLAAYGGVFILGALVWGVLVDKFRPDRWDLIGVAICLVGVLVIMYAPKRPETGAQEAETAPAAAANSFVDTRQH